MFQAGKDDLQTSGGEGTPDRDPRLLDDESISKNINAHKKETQNTLLKRIEEVYITITDPIAKSDLRAQQKPWSASLPRPTWQMRTCTLAP